MFGGSFAPLGWMFCQGQTLLIADFDTLFNLIGTTYGGDGQRTFNLPNLASRIPIHMGTSPSGTTYQIGEMAGTEQETLTTNQIPTHTHALMASNDLPSGNSPAGNVTGQAATKIYRAGAPSVNLNASSVSPAGGSQPHDNLQPFLVINFIIAVEGTFPSQG
jgi:microcystin-dependent protein